MCSPSNAKPGSAIGALPVATVARLLGARLDDFTVRTRLEKWAACWVSALCLGLFFLLAHTSSLLLSRLNSIGH